MSTSEKQTSAFVTAISPGGPAACLGFLELVHPSTPLRMTLVAREARKSGLPLVITTDPIIRI